MIKIYRESFRYFLVSLPTLLAVGALIEVALWLFQPKSESAVSFVTLTIVAYYFHRHFLFQEILSFRNQKLTPGAPPLKFGWFMLVSGALLLTTVGVGLFLAFSYLDRPSPGAMILIFLSVYLLTLSLFGTALPATVARNGTYRVSQGLRATFSTMWRLVLGPGVIGFVLILATVLAGRALGPLGVAEDSLMALALNIVRGTLSFLTTIFAVAVLCEMYRKTRPDPRTPQGPGAPDQKPA